MSGGSVGALPHAPVGAGGARAQVPEAEAIDGAPGPLDDSRGTSDVHERSLGGAASAGASGLEQARHRGHGGAADTLDGSGGSDSDSSPGGASGAGGSGNAEPADSEELRYAMMHTRAAAP